MISKRCIAWLAGSVLTFATTVAAGVPYTLAPDSFDEVQDEFRIARQERSLGVDKCLGWIERLYVLAEAKVGSAEGFDALTLVLEIGASRQSSEIQRAAAAAPERIVAGYSDDVKKIGPFLMRGADEELVKQVMTRTKSPAVKATCLYIEAVAIVDMGYAAKIPADLADHALAVLKQIRDDYGAEKTFEGQPFAEAIAGDLFQLEKLRIGMVAPDIAANDLDGVPFKLSDYRGKVVVLDFWGNW
jgi:hypothetical protein